MWIPFFASRFDCTFGTGFDATPGKLDGVGRAEALRTAVADGGGGGGAAGGAGAGWPAGRVIPAGLRVAAVGFLD